MISPWSFDSRIIVQSVTKDFDGLNATETWKDVETIWGSLIQLTATAEMKVVVEYGQRFLYLDITVLNGKETN